MRRNDFFLCRGSVFISVVLILFLNMLPKEFLIPGQFKSIQAAIDLAKCGDTVFVGKGTYRERLKLKTGVKLKGEGPEVTRILGDGKGEIIIGADNSVISGFTIQQSGNAFFAIKCDSTSPKIYGNILQKNGGGIYLINSSAVIEQNLIVGSDDGSDFGTMAIFCQSGMPLIKNNTIVNNNARFGIMCDHSKPVIKNNIIAFNLGGIGCFNSSLPGLSHNNVWSNDVVGNYTGCKPDVNSISKDPLFVNVSKGDYRLSPDSPCVRGKKMIGSSGYRLPAEDKKNE